MLTDNEGTTALPFELYDTDGDVYTSAYGYVKEIGNHSALGNYVIVDHGCGVYSWYCGLSEVRVTKGQIVAVGDRLGIAGRLSFGPDDTDTVLLMVTVGKTAVDPAYLREFNFNFGE